MIILGLGSNLGDRLENLRKAYLILKNDSDFQVIQVSPIYISNALLHADAPSTWNKPYLNVALRCDTKLDPFALLGKIKWIERVLGQSKKKEWGPRQIDIDLLAYDDLQIDSPQLTLPHAQLTHRPFALFPLADIAPLWIIPALNQTAAQFVERWGSRFDGKAPFETVQIEQRIDTPQLVGIVNITPDSFSDGGLFQTAESALERAIALVKAGALVIDLGAASTNPLAPKMTKEVEWQRLSPVLAAIMAARDEFFIFPKISIDTYHPEIAERALAQGVDWINDVTGLTQRRMREVLRESKADCVVMHHRSIPENRAHVLPRQQDPVKLVLEESAAYLNELEAFGIHRERIIFDPGIGFGKVAEQSLELIKNVDVFSQLQTRLMIGHSRKSFLSLFTHHDYPDRDIETTAISLLLAKSSVHYLRLHHVEMCARAFKVAKSVNKSP